MRTHSFSVTYTFSDRFKLPLIGTVNSIRTQLQCLANNVSDIWRLYIQCQRQRMSQVQPLDRSRSRSRSRPSSRQRCDVPNTARRYYRCMSPVHCVVTLSVKNTVSKVQNVEGASKTCHDEQCSFSEITYCFFYKIFNVY